MLTFISLFRSSMVKKKKMTAPEVNRVMSRLIGQSDADANWQKHFAKSDVVIEAVFEDLALKHKIIQAIEPLMKPSAIFATNTSALPIAEIAKASKRPERVVGMHYFSPVDKMPLLEIIPHAGTCNEASAIATDVGLKQGKTVIVVKDVPGFYVNRALGPFMAEVSALLADGADIQALDKALVQFGMPVGPITLADEVGIDVASHVQDFLSKHLGERMLGGPDNGALKAMLSAGMLGKKTGKGFYIHGSGKSKTKQPNAEALTMIAAMRRGSAPPPSVIDMQQRMILRFVNEAAFCLQDNIIADATR
jgi:enoyl-CoA hydratase/long-chain 3-hydroxyacyl-CoA dehydrogenase